MNGLDMDQRQTRIEATGQFTRPVGHGRRNVAGFEREKNRARRAGELVGAEQHRYRRTANESLRSASHYRLAIGIVLVDAHRDEVRVQLGRELREATRGVTASNAEAAALESDAPLENNQTRFRELTLVRYSL